MFKKNPCRDNIYKRSFKNGAHESLQTFKKIRGISLSVQAFLGIKERYSLITLFISISSKENVLSMLFTFSFISKTLG